MSDLVGNPEDRFSHVEAQFSQVENLLDINNAKQHVFL